MGAKPILRVGKIKASGRSTPHSVGAHLARSRPTPNADPSRTSQNEWLVDPGPDLGAAISNVMDRAGVEAKRKDAVLANDILLTVSPEWFRPDDPEAHGTWDENRLKAFRAEAEAFLRETFGPRVVAAALHLDEATPHVQAVVVPVMPGKEDRKQRRLSSKDMFGPGQLKALQQKWEDRLTPHGVEPRTKGSKARHTTLREYYGALEATRSEDPRAKLEFQEPPVRGRLESTKAYKARVETWDHQQRKQLAKGIAPMTKQAAQGRLWDAERRSSIELRGRLSEASESYTRLFEELQLTKEQTAELRATPINDVAIALGYDGEVGPKENAIDLVKRVGGLNYRQSVAWLAQNLGPDAAANAARENAARRIAQDVTGPEVWTKADKAKDRAVKQQLDALAAPAYRITVMRQIGDRQVGQNLGKTEEGEEFFTADQVRKMIPRLAAENARQGNIYVTPMDDAARHVLVDDLTSENLEELRSRGYAPANVLESSPGSFQAVIKTPADLPKADTNQWFKDLNRDLGDPKITGLVHPFRLAGFHNQKPKHQEADHGRPPFVKLIEATNRFCAKAREVVLSYGQHRRPGPSEAEPSSGPRR